MRTGTNIFLVYAGIVVAMIFWSMSFIWYKDAYRYFGPMTTIFLRLFISAILLLIISFATKQLKIKKEHYKFFLLAALFEPFLYFMGESYGMQLVSSVTASVIIATIPVLTPIVCSFFYDEKLTKINILGVILSFIGVSLVIMKKHMQFEASKTGVALMFLAVLAAISYAMALKKLIPHYKPITIVTIQNAIGAVLFAPLFISLELHTFDFSLPLKTFIPIINLAIFASSVAFILYAWGVNNIGINRANTFTNLIPVLTAIFSYFINNEQFTIIKAAGILVVVSGLFLTQLNVSMYRKAVGLFIWKKNDGD
jgi:drug/metabolite transporter (DMT)-like permease